jgi:hypothetical protein
MLMTDQQSSELAKPGVGSFDDPTPLVAAQFAPIFVTPLLIVLPVRHDQLDPKFLQSLAQRIRIVGGVVGNHPFRLLSRTAFCSVAPASVTSCGEALSRHYSMPPQISADATSPIARLLVIPEGSALSPSRGPKLFGLEKKHSQRRQGEFQ